MQDRNSQLKTSQSLVTAAFIVGPVSLVIGGVIGSIAAVVCSIIALVKVNRVLGPEDEPGSAARSLYRQCVVALAISLVCTCLNAAALVYTFGALMQAMQSGDYSSLLGSFGSDGGTSSPNKSIWD